MILVVDREETITITYKESLFIRYKQFVDQSQNLQNSTTSKMHSVLFMTIILLDYKNRRVNNRWLRVTLKMNVNIT